MELLFGLSTGNIKFVDRAESHTKKWFIKSNTMTGNKEAYV